MPGRAGPFDVHEGDAGSAGPVVVLFGWVGSSPRLLAKYASAFLARGDGRAPAAAARRVYSATARTVDVFLNPAGLRALARQALELLAERHAGEPAVLAYMSNGGAFVHLHIVEELKGAGARFGSAVRI